MKVLNDRFTNGLIRNNQPVSALTLLIGVASFSGYLGIGHSFWAGELPLPVILGLAAFGCLGLFKTVPIRLNSVDLVFLGYHAYLLINSIIQSFPLQPTDRIILPVTVVIFYLMVHSVMTDHQPPKNRLISSGLILLALLQSIIGILQYVRILPPFQQDYRSAGLFINPAIYGGFLAIGFCLAVLRLIKYRRRQKSLHIGIVLIIGSALLLSRSFTACIAAMLGLTIILCTLYPRHFRNLLHNIPVLTAIGVAVVVGVYLIFAKVDFGSFQGRILIWKISLEMVWDSPFFGHGYGSFFSRYSDYQADYFMSGKGSTTEMQLAAVNYYAFNEPLRILVEDGIAGLGVATFDRRLF